MMHEEGEKDDDRKRDPDQPKQSASTKTHCSLLWKASLRGELPISNWVPTVFNPAKRQASGTNNISRSWS
jgi:hypothetical protein